MNDNPRRAHSRSRRDIAYEHICELLTSGAYMPSDVIDVSEIVKTLNMSRQPIMTALQQLCIEELVQIIPQVGCIAAAYSHNEWHDLHRLFSAGEGLIAEIAAERRTDQEILSL
jgi:DNA-binding GntR family transcriptional regulator